VGGITYKMRPQRPASAKGHPEARVDADERLSRRASSFAGATVQYVFSLDSEKAGNPTTRPAGEGAKIAAFICSMCGPKSA